MIATTRDQLIYLAEITQQTEQYQQMVEAINKLIEMDAKLNEKQRNLLSAAYKNVVGAKRTAWKVICQVQKKKEVDRNLQILELLKIQKKKIEDGLNKYCYGILKLIEQKLLKNVENTEAEVFFHKMKGDYYRYITEHSTNDLKNTLIQKSGQAYKTATYLAEKNLMPANPIRLGLALNYSVYFYEIKNDVGLACQHAQKAFDDANASIQQIKQQQYRESTSMMQLLRDNLTLWTEQK